ncbi:MAG: hypothetical protein IPK78_18040 [Rhodospirillales bacterium]|nr:hypothetical protein [Rhodospirillales bacterium]
MIGSKRMLRLARTSGVIAVACCGVTATATAGEVLAWQRQPGSEDRDYFSRLATDAAGNVYMVGETWGSLGGANKGISDAWVRKYNPYGRVLWQRQPGTEANDGARGVATDAAGDVYLAGDTYGSFGSANKGGSDAWVRKYDASGRLLWQRQPGSEANDSVQGVATDAAGDVYLAGETDGSLAGANKGFSDAWVRKYDPSGRLLWQRQPGTEGYDWAKGVATNASGDVYVAGHTDGSLGGANKGSLDAWVRKYDASGRLLWQRQPGTEGNDYALGVATDAAGDVYLAGETGGSLGGVNKGGSDAWVRKYDAAGRLLWQRQPGTDDSDGASDVATDAAGDVYVAGYTLGSLGGANQGGADAWIAKYDSSGRLLWQRQPGTESNEQADGVATGAAGDVYLAGDTYGSFGSANKGGSDAWLMKFSPTE